MSQLLASGQTDENKKLLRELEEQKRKHKMQTPSGEMNDVELLHSMYLVILTY